MSTLQVNKQFVGSSEQLYKAWTEPDQLKQWWKPMGKKLRQVNNELQNGGQITYEFEDGLKIEGKYDEVKEHSLLVYSWNWNFTDSPVDDQHYKLHVHFKQEGDNATISIEQESFENEEQAELHRKGWDEGLGQLAHFLQQGTGSTEESENDSKQQVGKPPISGYNETPEQQKVGGG